MCGKISYAISNLNHKHGPEIFMEGVDFNKLLIVLISIMSANDLP